MHATSAVAIRRMCELSRAMASLDLGVQIGDASFSASGDAETVLNAYDDFKKLVANAPSPSPSKSRETRDQDQGEDAGKVKDPPKRTTDLPLKPFLAQYELRTNKEKAAAILAWSAEKGEQDALTASELEKLWKKTPFKSPGNLSRDLRKAEAEGWIDSEGKAGSPDAKFRINGYGEGVLAGWVNADAKD